MLKLFITFFISLSSLTAQDCEVGFTSIDQQCYFQADIDVLDIFLYNSEGSVNMILDDNGNGIIEPLELWVFDLQ